MIDDEGSVEGENECGASGLQDSVSDGGMGSLGPEYPGDSGSVPASPVRFGTPVRSPYPRSRSSSLSDSGMDHSSIVSPTVLSDWGRGRGGRRGRYRGTRRSSVRGRGRSETRDLSLPVASSHPSALSDPSSGRVRRGGRDRSRGRGARGVGGVVGLSEVYLLNLSLFLMWLILFPILLLSQDHPKGPTLVCAWERRRTHCHSSHCFLMTRCLNS